MKLRLLILLSGFSLMAYASDEMQQRDIQLRIQPVGQVSVQNTPQTDNKSTSTEKAGQQTYERYCVVCHKDGLAGAPRFRTELDWQSRLKGRSLDDLVASSLKGLNAMPVKGTCMKCTEDDLKAAISYMLPKS